MDSRHIAFGLALGAGIGVSFGAVIGSVTNSVGFWVAMGPSIGASLGLCAGIIIAVLMQPAIKGYCVKCGYSTKGLRSKICPECGGELSPEERAQDA